MALPLDFPGGTGDEEDDPLSFTRAQSEPSASVPYIPTPGAGAGTVVPPVRTPSGTPHSIAAQAPAPAPEVKSSATSAGVARIEIASAANDLSGQEPFRMDISFEQLGLDLISTGQRVLDGVTGKLSHGRLTAVMGPSGSGKTTFLTTVSGRSGRYGRTVGRIRINGVTDSLTKYRQLIGFVPQEDVMIRELTVEQNIRHSARCRLPAGLSDDEMDARIERVLKLLGLTEIRGSIIGDEITRGVSGGQRKRVNVGIELVADPVVLFLDEPTSGLEYVSCARLRFPLALSGHELIVCARCDCSSSSSFEVCRALQTIAHELKLTVIAVIHQPRYEIFTMFDDVLLLAKGGSTTYLGPSVDCEAYLASCGFPCPPKVNPSDHAMDVISVKENGRVLATKWAKLIAPQTAPVAGGNADAGGAEVVPAPAATAGGDWNMVVPGLTATPTGSTPDSEAEYFLSPNWLWFIRGIATGPYGVFNAIVTHTSSAASAHDGGNFVDALVLPSSGAAAPAPRRGQRQSDAVSALSNIISALCGCLLFSFTLIAINIGIASWVIGNERTITPETISLPSTAAQRNLFLLIWLVVLLCWTLVSARIVHLLKARHITQQIANQFETACHFMISFWGIGGVGMAWSYWRGSASNARSRTGSVYGFAFQLLAISGFNLVLFGGAGFGSSDPTRDDLTTGIAYRTGIQILFVLQVIGGGLIIVCQHRVVRLPTRDRITPGLFPQIKYCVYRSLTQQLASWYGVIFDAGMCILSGTFLGIIFYRKSFIPGVCSLNETGEYVCGPPIADPFFSQSSLVTLSLSLAAVASSMRVFGSEKAVFARESESAQSTEAYYIGKSIAHIPTQLLAPLCFALPFYFLSCPEAQSYSARVFGGVYAHSVAVYATAASFAYLISIIIGVANAMLLGVLSILVSMMFGGSQPRLPELGAILSIPTHISYVRWAAEIYYLLAMTNAGYESDPQTIGLLENAYGYAFDDASNCWISLSCIAAFVRFAAYIALVKKEP